MNNLSVVRRKTSFGRFKLKRSYIYGLALIDARNLVHSAIVSGDFWESIRVRLISQPMDPQVVTSDGQSVGLQVLGVGQPGRDG